jgi:hypothetical protein
MTREELVDKFQSGWDTFYNGWLSFMPEQQRPIALAVAGMAVLVWWVWLWGRWRLKCALNGHIQLNRKIDELQQAVYKANDRANSKGDPNIVETRTLFKEMMANIEKVNNTALQMVRESNKNCNEAMKETCGQMLAKVDTTVGKAMDRVTGTQDAGNKLLADTIRQFVDLSKSTHTASMQAVSEAIAKSSDDDDEEDEDE